MIGYKKTMYWYSRILDMSAFYDKNFRYIKELDSLRYIIGNGLRYFY